MRIALDTNRYSDLCRGDEALEAVVARAEAVFLPFVVLAELRAGFGLGTKARWNERTLQRFLAKPRVDALLASEQTTHHYAAIFGQLRKQGTPIPTNDLWIAAIAVEHGLALVTRDEHFAHIPQLVCID
ncbi:MAG: type II toxin-antitoxin system VapC family toxin [Planctomycetota bacterium]